MSEVHQEEPTLASRAALDRAVDHAENDDSYPPIMAVPSVDDDVAHKLRVELAELRDGESLGVLIGIDPDDFSEHGMTDDLLSSNIERVTDGIVAKLPGEWNVSVKLFAPPDADDDEEEADDEEGTDHEDEPSAEDEDEEGADDAESDPEDDDSEDDEDSEEVEESDAYERVALVLITRVSGPKRRRAA